MANINTILFDLDGVVIDSEPIHAKAKKLVLEKFNISYPLSIFDDYKGIPDKVFFDYVSETLDKLKQPSSLLEDTKKAIFEEIIDELKLIDGFLHFFGKVKDRGFQTALVSSTSLYSLALVDNLYNISGLFDLVITEVDTELHKPHPAPYLKALDKLTATTQNSNVIEDSPNGIISARKAGCFVYGLTSSFPSHILTEAGADEIVSGYAELIKKINYNTE